ncbi:MAG: Fe-S cluster assembly protein HesB [Nitrosarchaeum sp.]|nr:Fe-S cluster assembly protein HesB [Nitrosarchaeum sp.]
MIALAPHNGPTGREDQKRPSTHPDLVLRAQARPALANNNRPLPHPHIGSDAPANTSRSRHPLLPHLDQTWPDFKALTAARQKDILTAWQGLGYNNRAIRLQALAKEVCERHNATLPDTEAALTALPGIGTYTARAILAFAHNKPVPVIDTNIRRVLIHELGLQETVTQKELEQAALACIPQGQSRIWHNALMDYGALQKTARTTGIRSLSKQGKFEGSTRELRGKLLKHLLAQERMTRRQAHTVLRDERAEQVIADMERDGLIRTEGERIVLS